MKETTKDRAKKILDYFGDYDTAKSYIILWQDEYINEEDRLFRQEVKKEFLKL